MELQPFVLCGFLLERKWSPMKLWTEKYLKDRFGNKGPLVVRMGKKPKPKGEILHDHKCMHREFSSIGEMLDWMNNGLELETWWAYLDYKDISELLEREEAVMVDWTELGVVNKALLEDDAWKDSTIWIGTPGAYTPCHYDTYGFNLHAQIQGHKRWILFPPTAELCPTRLPYEESSVFSQLDVLGGPKVDAKLKGIIPRAITLGPGDLLFVPPGWWHSVQCVDGSQTGERSHNRICISVNKWFPVNSDRKESAKEAVLRLMMSLYTNSGLIDSEEYVCLSEQHSMEGMCLEDLAESVQFRLEHFLQYEETNIDDDEVKPPEEKRQKMSEQINDTGAVQKNSELDFFYKNFSTHPRAKKVPIVKWTALELNGDLEDSSKEKREETQKELPLMEQLKIELFEAMSHPEVLNALFDVIIKKRKGRSNQ